MFVALLKAILGLHAVPLLSQHGTTPGAPMGPSLKLLYAYCACIWFYNYAAKEEIATQPLAGRVAMEGGGPC